MISEGSCDTENSLCKQQQIYKRFWRMVHSQMQIKASQTKRTQRS